MERYMKKHREQLFYISILLRFVSNIKSHIFLNNLSKSTLSSHDFAGFVKLKNNHSPTDVNRCHVPRHVLYKGMCFSG